MDGIRKSSCAAIAVGGLLFVGSALAPIVRKKLKGPDSNPPDVLPRERPESLEVIIPAYLEAGTIADTLVRTRRQLSVWSGDSSITVIASDPDTAAAACGADRVVEVGRGGKPEAINQGVALSSAEAIVLMDANCEVAPDDWATTIMEDLRHASLVSGSKAENGSRESAYWRFERQLLGDAQMDESLAVVGELLAFRRSDFQRIPVETQLDDFWLACSFLERGLRVCVDSRVSAYEDEVPVRDQWERRVRIAAGFYAEALPKLPVLLRSEVGVDYALHKPLRMTVGAFGFWLASVESIRVAPPLSAVAFVGTLGWACLSYMRGRAGNSVVGVVSSALALQLVPPMALVRLVRRSCGHRSAGWKKVAR